MKLLTIGLLLSATVAQANEWYFGEWEVTDAKLPGISAMDLDEAKSWFGSRATYTKEKVTFRNEICETPVFEVHEMTEDEFYSSYKATYEQLNIQGNAVEILDVGCPSDWLAAGSTVIKANNQFSYTLWDGVFFKIEK